VHSAADVDHRRPSSTFCREEKREIEVAWFGAGLSRIITWSRRVEKREIEVAWFGAGLSRTLWIDKSPVKIVLK